MVQFKNTDLFVIVSNGYKFLYREDVFTYLNLAEQLCKEYNEKKKLKPTYSGYAEVMSLDDYIDHVRSEATSNAYYDRQ